jgi:hypothetical protein
VLHVTRESENIAFRLPALHDVARELFAGPLLHLLEHHPVTH